jgi:hypothetical protein
MCLARHISMHPIDALSAGPFDYNDCSAEFVRNFFPE